MAADQLRARSWSSPRSRRALGSSGGAGLADGTGAATGVDGGSPQAPGTGVPAAQNRNQTARQGDSSRRIDDDPPAWGAVGESSSSRHRLGQARTVCSTERTKAIRSPESGRGNRALGEDPENAPQRCDHTEFPRTAPSLPDLGVIPRESGHGKRPARPHPILGTAPAPAAPEPGAAGAALPVRREL